MTDESSNPHDGASRRTLLTWALAPLALFPLVALLTYDWHAIEALNAPAAASSNWIGALGDGFAYYGYQIFGLAIWIVPAVTLVGALTSLRGRRRKRSLVHRLWELIFLISVSCLLQAVSAHTPMVVSAVRSANAMCAGGWIGYLMMTKCLSPLVSDFGAAIIMVIAMVVSLVAAVGLDAIADALASLRDWAFGASARTTDAVPLSSHPPAIDAETLSPREQRRLEKARLKAEKEAEKERVKAEKEAEKERIRAAKEAARAGRMAETPSANVAPAVRAKPTSDATASSPATDSKGPYVLPPLSLLEPLKRSSADHGDVGEMTERLISTLKIFGVDATLAYTIEGPVVTKYALQLAPGIRYAAVTNLQDNLMGALHAKSLRIEAPIPGEECVGIEVPNRAPAGISFREIVESNAWKGFKGELPLLFGKDAAGKELIADLASMPHMLVAGATGQGKSVCLNAIINGLLMTKTPEQLKLIMVDPKSVEFSSYATLPHLIVPVITDNKKVVFSLHWAVREMENRLKLFARAKVKNIYDFNHRPSFTQTDMFGDDTAVGSDVPRTVPYIIIIIDEVADLMSSNGKEVTPDIARLTAKARAAGIHLILATQRPDAKVITGTIKANIPGRVAFKTAQAVDSRTILDEAGAENLIGKGDMLFKGKDSVLTRAQGAWISDSEIAGIVSFIEQHSNVQFDERFAKKLGTIKDDEVDLFADPDEEKQNEKAAAAEAREQVKADAAASDFKKAVECIINTRRASTSHFQRQMGWGYNHAAKILDMLEQQGIVAPQSGMGPRQIVMDQDQLLAIFKGDDENAAAEAEETAPAAADDTDFQLETNT